MQPQEDVDATYAIIDAEVAGTRWGQYNLIVAGDFNAEVGTRTDDYDDFTIGENPMRSRSCRGDALLKWCTYHKLVLTNTFGLSDAAATWTYRDGNTYKQLDYVIVDRRLNTFLKYCNVLNALDIGLDHRALICTFQCTTTAGRSDKRKRRPCLQWKPNDDYVTCLSDKLRNYPYTSASPSLKADFIQSKVLEAVEGSRVDVQGDFPDCHGELDRHINELICRRRELKECTDMGIPEKDMLRVTIGKQIQKLLRRRLAFWKTLKMEKILSDFKGLDRLVNMS
jgi:hypothetical protein